MQRFALACIPAASLVKALRINDLGKVNATRARRQHADYCSALRSFGYALIVLPENELFPDSTFVEDPAIIIDNDILVVSRLAHPARHGEESYVERALTPFFRDERIFRIPETARIEGGDVMVADAIKTLYIGLSARTNGAGAEALARIAKDHAGYRTQIIQIPQTWLHLKGEATFHSRSKNGPTITVSEEIVQHFLGAPCQVISTPAEERFGGNCISDNDRILIHKGCVRTKAKLQKNGFHVQELPLDEFAKIDGAMTCLSKLFEI